MKVPEFFKSFGQGLHEFGETVSIVFTTVLLTGVFVIGVGLTWLTSRVAGKYFLETSISKERSTYWVSFDFDPSDHERLHRQF